MAFNSSSTIFSHFPASFSNLPSDVIETHILPLLDGPTLSSTSCVSSRLHVQCTNENLWRNICNASWPSINDPRIRDIILTFPFNYRSFFYNSLPTLYHPKITRHFTEFNTVITEFISAVDIHYRNKIVYSTVKVTKTLATEGFLHSMMWLDVIGHEEPTMAIDPVKFTAHEDLLMDVAENVTLNWIVIDPSHKLAINLSSVKPVLVGQYWLTGYLQIMYSTLMESSTMEMVEFKITVVCGRINDIGKELQVMEVNLQVVDIDEKNLKWKDSLVILQEAMVNPRKGMGRERYKEYLKMKREKGTSVERKEESKKGRFLLNNVVCFASMLIIFVPVLLWAVWYVLTSMFGREKTGIYYVISVSINEMVARFNQVLNFLKFN